MMIVDQDEFVPASHLVRQVKHKIDFSFIYDKVKRVTSPAAVLQSRFCS